MTDTEQAKVLDISLHSLNMVKYGRMNFGHDNAERVARLTDSQYEIWRHPDMIQERKDALRRHKLIHTIKELQEELEKLEAA